VNTGHRQQDPPRVRHHCGVAPASGRRTIGWTRSLRGHIGPAGDELHRRAGQYAPDPAGDTKPFRSIHAGGPGKRTGPGTRCRGHRHAVAGTETGKAKTRTSTPGRRPPARSRTCGRRPTRCVPAPDAPAAGRRSPCRPAGGSPGPDAVWRPHLPRLASGQPPATAAPAAIDGRHTRQAGRLLRHLNGPAPRRPHRHGHQHCCPRKTGCGRRHLRAGPTGSRGLPSARPRALRTPGEKDFTISQAATSGARTQGGILAGLP
jgi:hypothetical protein